MNNDTLCWHCKHAVPGVKRGCEWSIKLKPVKGWKISSHRIYEGQRKRVRLESYTVTECPEFEEG